MPFDFTVNPYRGCNHARVSCFARKSHSYLHLDTGADFNTQLVRLNAGKVLRRGLSRPTWTNQHVAMGPNTDPYHRAEGRYRLMPSIMAALTDIRTPFSILIEGTLLARDIDALRTAPQRMEVGMG